MDKMRRFLILIFIIFSLPCYAGEEQQFVPWDSTAVSKEGENATVKETDTTFVGYFLIQAVKFYQNFISPITEARCPMYPSCSVYSIEAIEKHGAIMGFVMTADRLLHEINETDHAPMIKKGGRWKYYDPVSNNDFWWYRESGNVTSPAENRRAPTSYKTHYPCQQIEIERTRHHAILQ
jgi:putative membrane protein insertion efficiency factor